jgi:hypothetical protein
MRRCSDHTHTAISIRDSGQAILQQCKKRWKRRFTLWKPVQRDESANLLAEETDLQTWFAGAKISTFEDVAAKLGIDENVDSAPSQIAWSLVERATDSGDDPLSHFAIAARISDANEGERRVGDIAFCLNVNGERHERTHRVEANPDEIRRRAALWACEFLHVSLATTQGVTNG